MPLRENPNDSETPPTPDLHARILRYKEAIENVLREVGEHPLYEMKAACPQDTLAQRIELIKDIQSIATSRIETERFLVIGANEEKRSFVPVNNTADFDEAKIRKQLEKYLAPAPEFELFKVNSSEGHAYVFFVIPRQRTRRILARVTVEDPDDKRQKLLLREGDLWTKGGSTGKRLATVTDWDEIYADVIEKEAEERTRRRTSHLLEEALAAERVRLGSGLAILPSHLTDESLKIVAESICATKDETKIELLLERMRDDLIEGWHGLRTSPEVPLQQFVNKVEQYKTDIFAPAMRRLVLLGIYIVKNNGPTTFLARLMDLLRETYETSHFLQTMRGLVPHVTSQLIAGKHLSHTVPALESLIALHTIGGYVLKRNRLQYFRTLLGPDVFTAGKFLNEFEAQKTVMAFWPLSLGHGEPEELQHRAGKIQITNHRIEKDPGLLSLFGSAELALEALVRYEFLLEFNSFLAMQSDVSPDTAAYVTKFHPKVFLGFWPSIIAFPLEPIFPLAVRLFQNSVNGQREFITSVLFDPNLAGFLIKPGGSDIIAKFLKILARDQARLMHEMGRWRFPLEWPGPLKEAIAKADISKVF